MIDNLTDSEERLLITLSQELELFERVLDLTEKQTEQIAADMIDELNESLDHRQELIEKINGLHQESDSLMQSYISSAVVTKVGKNNKIEVTIEHIRDIMAKCAVLDEKNTAAAKEKAEGFADRIGKLNLNRKSLGSYIQGVANNSEMFDKTM